VRAVYDLYGKGDNVETWFQEAPHNYNQPNREAMYAFFGKHVLGVTDPSRFKEGSIHIEKLQDMLVLMNRKLPDNALSFEQLFDEWKRFSREQTGDRRERLTFALAAEWPREVLSQVDGERIVLGRAGRGDRIPGIWLKGTGSGGATPVLVVHPEGAQAARQSPEVARLIAEGRSVLMVDAFQTGSAVAPRDRSAKMFLTFNKSDDANRVQDVLTALAWLHTPKMRLVGLGKASVWCLFAAAVADEPVELEANLGSFTGTDQEFVDSFFVPGLQRAGGLLAAKELAGVN